MGPLVPLAILAAAAAPGWNSTAIHTTCEALRAPACRGLYGLTIGSDGSFLVGPAPTGAQLTGRLAPEELGQLSRDVEGVLAADTGAQPECTRSLAVPGVGTVVDLMPETGSLIEVYRDTRLGVCTRGGAQSARVLNNDMQILLRRYYPTPFPAEPGTASGTVTR